MRSGANDSGAANVRGQAHFAALADDLRRDLRQAFRVIRKSPGFLFFAVLPLALGVSATTTVFGLVDALLLRSLPVPEADRLYAVQEDRRGPNIGNSMGYTTLEFWRYDAWRDAATPDVFSGLTAFTFDQFSLRQEGGAEVLNGYIVSSNYFAVLGIAPVRGRFFTVGEEGAGTDEPVAVISHDLWQRRFSGDGSVLGRIVYINGRPLEVIGIAPAGFGGTLAGLAGEVWIPARAYQRPLDGTTAARATGMRFIWFGRLRPGLTPAQAEEAMGALARQVPPDNERVEILDVRLERLTAVPAFLRTGAIGFAGALFVTAAAVLLVAVFNVGGLLLARAATRRQELAVRLAIGAGRGRLVRQLLTEGVVLFSIAAGAGVILANWMMALLSTWQPPLPARFLIDVRLDVPALLVALGTSIAIGLLFSLVPAFQETRWHPAAALKHGGTWTVHRSRTRSFFVVAQIAMSVILLIVAGLFVRGLQSALRVDPGFAVEGVGIANVSPGSHGYDRERGLSFFDQLAERLEATPGIEAVGYGMFMPLSNSTNRSRARAGDVADEDAGTAVQYGFADAGYFEAVSTPVVAGRAFDDSDRTGPPVVVINGTLEQSLWPGASAVGRTVNFNGETHTIVGVTTNGRYDSLNEPPTSYVFVPLKDNFSSSRMVYVRSRTDAGNAIAALRTAVAGLDPDIALEQTSSLAQLVGIRTIAPAIAAGMIGAFGLMGLLLAAIGIYGIVAYQVAQRSKEFGIRRAIGATTADVRSLVLRHGLTLAGLGVASGLVLAFAATRLTARFLGNLAPPDVLPFVVFPVVLAVIALIASWFPARRAARIDPMHAMRAE
jgi:predicted permease